ncbi:hypothetical protein OROMI_025132 [Orobanche minor]
MCTNLHFRMMAAIMFGEPVNWCQIVLKRLQEEVSKPVSQKKYFGLILNNLLTCLDIPVSDNAKKIGPGKFIGGCKPTAFNKDVIPEERPSVFELPQSKNPRDMTDKISASVSSKKRKHGVSDRKSPPAAPLKKKIKNTHKAKPTEVPATPIEAQIGEIAEVAPSVAQPTVQHLQGITSVDPEPMAAMMNEQLFAKVEGSGESVVFIESAVASPVRVSTPIQDPYPHRVPSPVHDPSPIRVLTPVRTPFPEQASIPVADPIPIVIPIPVRISSPTQIINDTPFSVQVEQAYERFVQWKSYRTASYDILYHSEDWETVSLLPVLKVMDTMDIDLLIHGENSFCHELITNFYITQAEPRLKGKTKSVDTVPSSPSKNDSDDDDDAFQVGLRMSREEAQESEFHSSQVIQGQGTSKDVSSPHPQEEAINDQIQEESVLPVQPEEIPFPVTYSSAIPQEESVPLPDQAEAERQQEESVPPVPSSTEHHLPQNEDVQLPAVEPVIDAPASPCSPPDEFLQEDRPMRPTHPAALFTLTCPEDKLVHPSSPRSEQRKERLHALGSQTVFVQDAVDALHRVGKALAWLNVSAAEEMDNAKSELSNVAEDLKVLPQLLITALANIQRQREEILEKEHNKLSVCEARSVAALKESGSKLIGHNKNLDNMSRSLQSLADKFSKVEEKQEDVLMLIHSIDSHVSEINARKGEEESREATRRWRLQQEAEINAAIDDSVSAAINHLAVSAHPGYTVSGSHPEYNDSSVPWKSSVQSPAEMKLPTDRQPSPEEIKRWKKNELMRYFIKPIRESTLFDKCKMLSEVAMEFSNRLERGVLSLQLAMKSKHRK